MRRANRIAVMTGIVIALLLFNQFFRTGERTLSASEASLILGGEPGEYYDACCILCPECVPEHSYQCDEWDSEGQSVCQSWDQQIVHQTTHKARCAVMMNPGPFDFCQEDVPERVCLTVYPCKWDAEFSICYYSFNGLSDMFCPDWCFDYCM